MRNDAFDELDTVPSLTTGSRDRDDFGQDGQAHERGFSNGRAAQPVPVRSASSGFLWALVVALSIALGGLAWWSVQQLELMEQQLVATQESFARISEEATGRIQDISGQVVATESSALSDSEALKLQVKQLQTKVADLSKQQQTVARQQTGQTERIEALNEQLKTQQGASSQFTDQLKAQQGVSNQFAEQLKVQQGTSGQLADQLKTLGSEQGALKTAAGDLDKVQDQVKSLSAEVQTLKKAGNPSQAIGRLEEDLLVLRSQLDARPAPSNTAASAAEFDAFRGQMTRNINTLRAQMQNLQGQLNDR
ncbi:MAG: ATPase [Pseudomonas sp.]